MSHTINILLLTYNNLSNTKECINSIYKHTNFDDFKLFILDNCSKSETVEYLKDTNKQHDNIYINFQDINHGIIKGRNKCFDFSKDSDAQYIIFLDNDQHVQENWLDSYLKIFEDGYDIVGIEAWKMDHRFYPYEKVSDKNDSFSYCGCGGMMMEREFFRTSGRFDERFFIYFEDPDFCFRAYYMGYKIGWNSDPVIIHNHKGPLLSNENRKYFMESWKKFQEEWKGSKVPVFTNLISQND